MTNTVIINLLMAQNQMKIFHWQTESYAQHKAFGKVYDNLSGLIDDFVEVCMGKHGRPSFQGEFNIPLFDFNTVSDDDSVNSVVLFLLSFSQLYNPETDSDLLNIRDEMLAEMNRLKYLLTLS
jgi:hypothetical protein